MSTTTAMTFTEFEADARRHGFDEVLQRDWVPGTVTGEHTHPFSVKAVIACGEMWLTVGDEVKHLRSGDGFELGRGIAHHERYGDEGATVWAARRHAAGSDTA